jgi:chaperone BCS1
MDGDWYFSHRFYKRNIDSIFIEQNKKDLIFNNLFEFMNKENWYIEKGIPYQYGILLYGSPGTGKTSLIKTIASKLDYNIYYLSPQKISSIEKALVTCPEKAIVVIEDIDTSHQVQNRKNKESEKNDDIIDFFSFVNLSDILNSIDGLGNVHGRILICTTNHIERLDPALIRPGRFDLKIEIGYVNKEILSQFFEFYFPDKKINLNNLQLKNEITVADLQNMILLGYDELRILEEIKQ